MRKIFYSFLISAITSTFFSCGKSTDENVNFVVSKTNDTVNNTVNDNIHGTSGENWGDSDFQINPQEVAGLWEFVTTISGYALVRSKERRPWIQIIDIN